MHTQKYEEFQQTNTNYHVERAMFSFLLDDELNVMERQELFSGKSQTATHILLVIVNSMSRAGNLQLI